MLSPMSRIAIIGGGSMGEALLSGLLRAGRQVKDLVVAEKYPDRAKYLSEKYSVLVTSVADAADNAAYVVIAVKPTDVASAIDEIADAAARADSDTAEQVFVSIAAGVSTSYYENKLPAGSPVIRVMPNSPIVVGGGVSALAAGRFATAEQLKEVFPATMELCILAFGFALVVGIPVGMMAGIMRGKWQDKLISALALIGFSIPIFWLALLLTLFFSLTLGWLPAWQAL